MLYWGGHVEHFVLLNKALLRRLKAHERKAAAQSGSGRMVASSVRKQPKRDRVIRLIDYFERIGWNKEFVQQRLSVLRDVDLDQDYRNEESVYGFSTAWAEEAGVSTNVYENLLNAQINQTVADRLYREVLQPLAGSSYTHEQLFDIAIEFLTEKYKPIRQGGLPFYYRSDVVGQWMSMTYRDAKERPVINIPHRCSVDVESVVQASIRQLGVSGGGKRLFYHATSWGWGLSILEELNRSAGRPCLDFSVYPGFYVGPRLRDALSWGSRNHGYFRTEVAILVFSLPTEWPTDLRVLKVAGQEWSERVEASRRCIKINSKRIDLIYGDMCANTEEVRAGGAAVAHKPPRKQLCTGSDRGDDFLWESICGCMCFSG
jgi:hypothetical protein